MALAWLYMAAAAVGGAGMLWHELHKHKDEKVADAKQVSTKRKHRTHVLAATASPAAAAIPLQELRQLEALLLKVYAWRGWQGGTYHVTQAWHEAEMAAATAAAGSWEQDFGLKQMTDANCNSLLRVIDQAFFGGRLIEYLAAKQKRNQQQCAGKGTCGHGGKDHSSSNGGSTGSTLSSSDGGTTGSTLSTGDGGNAGMSYDTTQPTAKSSALLDASCSIQASSKSSSKSCKVSCTVVQRYGPTDTWLAYFDESNVIFINNWRWINKHINPASPLNVEGVICTNRLQMLLHTFAHELVHALVFHVFPDIDKSSPAYLQNARHGPIFQLLNKQLFGHSSDALERVQLLEVQH